LVVTKPKGKGPPSATSERSLEAVVATLGAEPQVVTLTLDQLLRRGRRIGEVRVVHTCGPTVLEGLDLLRREFQGDSYPGITLRAVPCEGEGGPVEDFRTSEDVGALLRVLYREVRELRRMGFLVHLSISGGRKVMAVAGMVVAQLLFGPDDRVWHLLTETWAPGAQRQMHLPSEEPVWLVEVPVLRWTDSPAMLSAIAELGDPMEAIRRYEELMKSDRMRRRREFVERWLTPAEREVVRLACEGLDNLRIARRLGKSERTVAHQLTAVYGKLTEWLGYPPEEPRRNVLIAELSPYFALREETPIASRKRFPVCVGNDADAGNTRGRYHASRGG